MAWNRPSANGPTIQKKSGLSPAVKGLLGGGIVVAALAVVLFLVFGGNAPEKAKPEKKGGLIKEVTPAPSRKPAAAATNETESATQSAAKPAKKKPTQPPGYQRVMTLMDGTVVTNKSKAVFKRPLENFLAAAAMRPNGTGRTLLVATWKQLGDAAFLEMLKEMTVPEEGDSDSVRKIKETVQKTKEAILLEVANGRSLESIFAGIAHDNSMDRMVNAQSIRAQSEAIRSGDAESVRQATEAVNEIRRKRGLEDLEVPQRFRQNDDWGMVPAESPAEAEPESADDAAPEAEADAQ